MCLGRQTFHHPEFQESAPFLLYPQGSVQVPSGPISVPLTHSRLRELHKVGKSSASRNLPRLSLEKE